MSTPPPFVSTVAVKSMYDVHIFLRPVRVVNPEAGMGRIRLHVSGNKTLPGIADGETWEFSTDNPNQEIAEIITGKFGGVSQLAFDVPYDPDLLQLLVAHAKTRFTVEVIYDDTEYDDIFRIDVLNCFLLSPGSTSGAENNSAGTMTVTLQPRGGGKLADSMAITKAPRS